MRKIQIAFIKDSGMTAGGTERWLQNVAAALPQDEFEVVYFYTGKPDPDRLIWMQTRNVHLVEIKAKGKTPSGEWAETDLFEKFDETKFDIIQTAIAGPPEWPYCTFTKPVVQKVALNMGADLQSNVYHSFFMSYWLRRQWVLKGGSVLFSSVIPFGVSPRVSVDNMREELGIPTDAIVAGFHQRIDDDTFSPVPLAAFAQVCSENTYFVIMGGSQRYQKQARELKLSTFRYVDHSADPARISSFLNTLDFFAQGRRDGETFGYVFAEALMHKKACLGHAAECNAHRETIGSGGLWATTKGEYVAHLRRLFTDSALRQRLAQTGYDHACNTFDNKKGLSEIIKVYKQIYSMSIFKYTLLFISRATRRQLQTLNIYNFIFFVLRLKRKFLHIQGKFY